MQYYSFLGMILIGLITLSCSTSSTPKSQLSITKEIFGQMPDGRNVDIYTLTNANGMTARITNYGAIVQKLTAPDRHGKFEDVVLGYDKLDDYLKDSPYFGAIVGRYGNRIAKGKFTLDGVECTLANNNGANHLHGGIKGFDKVLWDARPNISADAVSLELTYLSKDGEEGYPGNLKSIVIYSLTNNNELKIEYAATTDKATPCNLTHHSYFNLSGDCKSDILNQVIWMNADRFTPVDAGLIPTGELRPVKNNPFDFTTATAIGARINADDEQLKFGLGYDHNWVLNNVDGSMKLQATLYDPASGRLMEIHTVEPGLQFYSGNFLNGSNIGKGGKVYNYRFGMCLETQHYPDSPNQPNFPSTILKPGETYHTQTFYRFFTN